MSRTLTAQGPSKKSNRLRLFVAIGSPKPHNTEIFCRAGHDMLLLIHDSEDLMSTVTKSRANSAEQTQPVP